MGPVTSKGRFRAQRLVRLLPAVAMACGASGCGNQVGPAEHELTVRMSDSGFLPSSRSLELDPAPLRGAAQLQASATVSYLAGVSVAVRALVPRPPSPGQIGRIVRVTWQGCDRVEGELTCVVANLQSDRTVSAAFEALEVFPPPR